MSNTTRTSWYDRDKWQKIQEDIVDFEEDSNMITYCDMQCEQFETDEYYLEAEYELDFVL